jgi:hypothetical protein
MQRRAWRCTTVMPNRSSIAKQPECVFIICLPEMLSTKWRSLPVRRRKRCPGLCAWPKARLRAGFPAITESVASCQPRTRKAGSAIAQTHSHKSRPAT